MSFILGEINKILRENHKSWYVLLPWKSELNLTAVWKWLDMTVAGRWVFRAYIDCYSSYFAYSDPICFHVAILSSMEEAFPHHSVFRYFEKLA